MWRQAGSGFALLHDYAFDRLPRTGRKVQRLALVVPAGIPGAVVSGFYPRLAAPFPVRLLDEREAALLWLDERDAAATAATLDAALTEVLGASPMLVRPRALLRDQPAARRLHEVARRPSLAPRTLQQRLHAEGTTLAHELLAARLAADELRLRTATILLRRWRSRSPSRRRSTSTERSAVRPASRLRRCAAR